MGFLDRVRKALGPNTKIEEEKPAEKVKSADISSWIQNQKDQIVREESEFLKQINIRTSQLANELEKEVISLQAVDLDDIKAEKRAKLITKINLDKYIEHLKNLTETLQCFEVDTSDNLMETITEIFKTFEQKSMKNFQKAAFLAGHKLNNIGVSTGRFFKDIRQIVKDNEKIISTSKLISSVDSKLDEINNFEKTQLEFKSKVSDFEQKISQLKSEKKSIVKEIEQVKTSKSYANELKKQSNFEKDKSELREKTCKLKTLIDFKVLANTFHSNPKQLAIVRDYKSDFDGAFQIDLGEKLTQLLKAAEVSQSNVFRSIDEIVSLKQKIENTVFEKDKVEILSVDIKKIKLQIEDIVSKKELEQKKHNKFQASKEQILNSIRDKLSKINVVLE